MKKYSFVQPDIQGNPETLIFTEEEILKEYWNHWRDSMIRKFGKDCKDITKKNCIDDWVTVHWAQEVK